MKLINRSYDDDDNNNNCTLALNEKARPFIRLQPSDIVNLGLIKDNENIEIMCHIATIKETRPIKTFLQLLQTK